MWDNPRLLNTAANALIALAALLFAYAGLQLLLRSPLFPLREIVVRGDMKNADAVQRARDFFAIGIVQFATHHDVPEREQWRAQQRLQRGAREQ